MVGIAQLHRLAAKLTGAGGGGCAFVLLRPTTDAATVARLRADMEAAGFALAETSVGSQGVRPEPVPAASA